MYFITIFQINSIKLENQGKTKNRPMIADLLSEYGAQPVCKDWEL
jgi:hypothetical protein